MRRLFYFTLVLGMLLSSFTVSNAASTSSTITERPDIQVIIDGVKGNYTNNPIIVNGRTLLPLRELLTNLGVANDDQHIIWDINEKTVTAIKDSVKIYLKVGDTTAKINDKETTIDAAPVNYNGRVYIPARFVGGAFGMEVTWDGNTSSVYIGQVPVQEVKVNTAEEFVKAIGSNKKIVLEQGKYDLSKIKHESNADYSAVWEYVEDGQELIIQNVSNLTIEGSTAGKTELITTPRFAEIMTFKNSSDVVINNITAGHTPMDDYICNAGVLGFTGCKNISINNSEFYGCGSVGLYIDNTTNLKCDNVNINHCSLRAIDIYNSKDITLSNTRMQDHEAYSNIVYIVGSSNILLEGCDITNNNNFSWSLIELDGESDAVIDNCKITNNHQEYSPSFGVAYFFRVNDTISDGSGSLLIKNSIISGNECNYLTDDENTVTFENCVLKNNIWDENSAE